MSLSDTPAYCEEADVQKAMQEVDMSFTETPLGSDNVQAAIFAASRWLRRRSGAHFYDSGGDASDLIDTTAATATDIQMGIPSSPHPQDGSLFKVAEGVNRQRSYPVTHAGRYARAEQRTGTATLGRRFVESIDRLAVRELGGETTDWVAASDKAEGRGEDYYFDVDGATHRGRSYLYLDAAALGPRRDFTNLLTVDVSYGLDWQDDPWADVRRGVGHLAAAELVVDDDVLTAISDEGQLIGVDTQAQQHFDAAMERYLPGWLGVGVA
jgi:hypothetical protein